MTGVNESTLRNWEDQYDDLNNVRRINNRRHYTAEDIATIRRISEGRETRKAQKDEAIASNVSDKHEAANDEKVSASIEDAIDTKQNENLISVLTEIRSELKEIADRLR